MTKGWGWFRPQEFHERFAKTYRLQPNTDLFRAEGFPRGGSQKLTRSHILGLQLRTKSGERVPGVIEAATGEASTDDLGNSHTETSMMKQSYHYEWDRPFLVPLPISASEGAKELTKINGNLNVQPGCMQRSK